MGLDGGTYVTRSDVLRRQSWALAQADTSRSTRGGAVSSTATHEPEKQPDEARSAPWNTCALSGERLQAPVVADYLGNVYNKASVLEHLLCKREVFVEGEASLYRHINRQLQLPGAYMHINSMKDVFPVQLEINEPAAAGTAEATASSGCISGGGRVSFTCPVTQLPLDGRQKACALVLCGHVVSEKALAAVGGSECPVCGLGCDHTWDVIPLNPSAEAASLLKEKLHNRKAKGKKRKRSNTESEQ